MLFQTETDSFLIDAGEGSAQALLQEGIASKTLRAIYLSHMHTDHVCGMPMILQGLHLQNREAPLNVYCPESHITWLHSVLRGLYIFPEKWSYPISILPLEESAHAQNGVSVTAFMNTHLTKFEELAGRYGMGAIAYSFQIQLNDEHAVISADIAAFSDIEDWIKGAAFLVLDTTHIPLSEIKEFAEAYPSLQIFCTHIPPEVDASLSDHELEFELAFGKRVLFASDGMKFDWVTKKGQ